MREPANKLEKIRVAFGLDIDDNSKDLEFIMAMNAVHEMRKCDPKKIVFFLNNKELI